MRHTVTDAWGEPTARPEQAQGRAGRTRGAVVLQCVLFLALLGLPATAAAAVGLLDEVDAVIVLGSLALTGGIVVGVAYAA